MLDKGRHWTAQWETRDDVKTADPLHVVRNVRSDAAGSTAAEAAGFAAAINKALSL